MTETSQRRFNRTINVANVILALVLLVSVVRWAGDTERSIQSNTQSIEQIKSRSSRDWELNREARNTLKLSIDDIKAMLREILLRQQQTP